MRTTSPYFSPNSAIALIGRSPAGALRAAHQAGDALSGVQGLLGRVRQEDLVRVAATSLRELPRLVDMTRASVRLLGRVYPSLRQSLSIQERSLAVQEQSLARQRETVALARQTLSVARATLSHAESID